VREFPHIAVLMTCHNRKLITCACLKALKAQRVDADIDVYLVDDGSSDGTSESVRALWDEVILIRGNNGDLWWNGGMRLAWKTAKAADARYDYYLWLNDDVFLTTGALKRLLDDMKSVQKDRAQAVIVVGATKDPATGCVNYGGLAIRNPRRPLRMAVIEPTGSVQPCDTMSGNCVLISRAAEKAVGNLREDFKHIFGDLDYGLRAKRSGVLLYASSSLVGTCANNSTKNSSLDKSLSKLARLRRRLQEERRIDAKDWRRFARLHSGLGPFSIAYSVPPYLRIVFQR
jgi:GT2 family glycosyltransferase